MDLVALLQRREGKTLESKRDLSTPDGFLKTLAAFADNCGAIWKNGAFHLDLCQGEPCCSGQDRSAELACATDVWTPRRAVARSGTASVYFYLISKTFRYPVPEEESALTKHAMSLALALIILCAFGAVAADVTGTWFGRVEMGPGRVMEQTIILKVQGGKLTGTVKTASGEMGISDGKINGDEISFAATREAGGNTMKMVYKGKISGNEIKFMHGREGGQQREFTAKRTGS